MVGTVVTDLDGTLLDGGDELGPPAKAGLAELSRRGIPVVPLTSKTEDELRLWLAAEGFLRGSFENGAGLLAGEKAQVFEEAVPVDILRSRLAEARRATGLRLPALSDLTDDELCAVTGLEGEKAARARARRFDLPFLASTGEASRLLGALGALPGLRLTRGGIFWHLSGDHDKGTALCHLLRSGPLTRPVVGLGDAENDASFLALVDIPVLIPGPNGVDPTLAARFPEARVAPAPAGAGWASAVRDLLEG